MKKQRKMKEMNSRGITLIALVVTIVVLIILATVSINAVFSENGIIKKAELAKSMHANAVKTEEEDMDRLLGEYNNALAEPPAPPTYVDESLVVAPSVADGMTKVKYNSTSKKWERVTDDSAEWYNYANKEWANVVLPAEGTTDELFNSDGTLNESKKYVQLVWIPRYAYQITSQYHTSGSTAGNINVVFIGTDNKGKDGTEYSTTYPSATTSTGMSGYVVHPAFNYGGEALAGFWVGKFESSNTSCTTTPSTGTASYIGSEVMTVKPGVTSWRNLTIGDMYAACLAMNKSGNVYGLNSDDSVVDPHLTKNSEWGAVAYLSKSSYGKQTEEVWINPNSNYITGQAGTGPSVSSTTSTNAYTTENGVKASTTGNATGVYDMSGGAWEYVAAYVNNGNSNLTSYGRDLVGSSTASKYRDVYSKGSSDSGANNYAVSTPANGKYGDAVYETSSSSDSPYTNSWYSDYSVFPHSSYPFFARSGGYSDETSAGVFYFHRSYGNAYENVGFRVVVPVL